MTTFREYLENVTYSYDRQAFVNLPWNWQDMLRHRVVSIMYYYSRQAYVNGRPEELGNQEFSLITLPNLKSIPSSELSLVNISTGHVPSEQEMMLFLKSPQTWYDDKINQVYSGIEMVGKRPEDFGGIDIRRASSLNTGSLA